MASVLVILNRTCLIFLCWFNLQFRQNWLVEIFLKSVVSPKKMFLNVFEYDMFYLTFFNCKFIYIKVVCCLSFVTEYDYKSSGGSSQYKFGILAKIVKFMKVSTIYPHYNAVCSGSTALNCIINEAWYIQCFAVFAATGKLTMSDNISSIFHEGTHCNAKLY